MNTSLDSLIASQGDVGSSSSQPSASQAGQGRPRQRYEDPIPMRVLGAPRGPLASSFVGHAMALGGAFERVAVPESFWSWTNSVEQNVERVLGHLAENGLSRAARCDSQVPPQVLPGHEPFYRPCGPGNGTEHCMLPSDASTGRVWRSGGYSRVRLGLDAEGKPVDEAAHVIVCSFVNGFKHKNDVNSRVTRGSAAPAAGMGQKWVVCHTCGCTKCLNPCHMVWGTQATNIAHQKLKKHAKVAAKAAKAAQSQAV